MSSQQKKWEKEYKSTKGIPTTTRTKPSSSVVKSIEYLEKRKLLKGKQVVDLGCGTGRNSLYLANLGFKVTAVDFSQTALNKLKKEAKKQELDKSIKLVNASIGKKLSIKANLFDLALDIVSSLSLDDKQFKVFANEVKQIVRPGGFFVCYVLSDKDEFYQRYGNGQGHYLAPKSDLLEYCRSKKEILDNFKKWKVIFSVEKEKVDDYYGKVYKRRLVWLLLQNEK